LRCGIFKFLYDARSSSTIFIFLVSGFYSVYLVSDFPLSLNLKEEIFYTTEWLFPEILEWDKFLDSDFTVNFNILHVTKKKKKPLQKMKWKKENQVIYCCYEYCHCYQN
jgi:hypothetical protein